MFWKRILISLSLLLFLSASVILATNNYNKYRITKTLHDESALAEDYINSRFRSYEYGLRGLRGAIVSIGESNFNINNFEQYSSTRDMSSEFKGALGIGYIRRVTPELVSEFERRASEDLGTDFSIKELSSNANDRFVIQYIHPLAPNRQAVGLDIASEKNRFDAAIDAAKSSQAKLTYPITLVQADKKVSQGALMLLPVYRRDALYHSQADRLADTIGWTYAPIIYDQVLADYNKYLPYSDVELKSADGVVVFKSSDHHSNDRDVIERRVSIYGVDWVIRIISNEGTASIAGTVGSELPLIIIFAFSLALYFYLARSMDLTSDAKNLDFSSYVSKSDVRGLALYLFLILACTATVLGSYLILAEFDRVRESMISRAAEEDSRITLYVKNRSNELRVVSELSVFKSDLKKIKDYASDEHVRAVEVLKSYARSMPDVYQARFIGFDGAWIEAIKLRRIGDDFVEEPLDKLQDKSNEKYIKETADSKPGEIVVSDVSLNREFGEIELPERPVWRFSVLIDGETGQKSGMIVINFSAEPVFILPNMMRDGYVCITSSNGQFISHPSTNIQFLLDKGKDFGFDEMFIDNGLSRFLSDDFIVRFDEYLSSYVMIQTLPFMLNNHGRFFDIHVIQRAGPIYFYAFVVVFTLLFLIFLITSLVIYVNYYWWRTAVSKVYAERNLHELSQKDEEARTISRILDALSEAVFLIDEKKDIVRLNRTAVDLFGLVDGASIYKLLLIDKENPGGFARVFSGIDDRFSSVLKAKNISGILFDADVLIVSVVLGEDKFFVVSVHDVSDRLRIERELSDALLRAEQSSKAKSQFLANTSHEIRTPLNAIIGFSRLLKKELVDDNQLSFISRINTAAISLLDIVNDVLDISKIESNEMKIDRVSFDVRSVVNEVVDVFTIQAESKGIKLEVDFDLPSGSVIVSDPVRIRQIITNLVNNAIKFTPEGVVTVSIKIEPVAESAMVYIVVSDTGLGIKKESIKTLFDPFVQEDESITRKFGGTGLGLSIVKNLSDLLGGGVSVDSTQNEGSKFTVTFPAEYSDLVDIERGVNTANLNLLIAQESDILVSFSKVLGWSANWISTASSLKEFLNNYTDDSKHRVDVLILDAALLTDFNKFDRENIFGLIKENGFSVIVSTGNEVDETEDYNEFIDGVLVSPYDLSDLFNAVSKVIGFDQYRLTSSVDEEGEYGMQYLPGLRILVVDDNEVNLELASYMLKLSGAEPKLASSASEAIEELRLFSDKYDAVLMDVQMPGMDGLKATQIIRNDLKMVDLPVIALTAGAFFEERDRAMSSGMSDFLTKPILPEKLMAVIRKHVKIYRDFDIPVVKVLTQSAQYFSWPDIPGLNANESRKLLSNNVDNFHITLCNVVELGDEVVSFLLTSSGPYTDDKSEILAKLLHKLRSSSGLIGHSKLHDLSTSMEISLRNSETIDREARNFIQEIDNLKANAKPFLDEVSRSNSLKFNMDSEIEVSQDKIDRILILLDEFNLSAIDLIEEISPYLVSRLGVDAYQDLERHLKDLDFEYVKAKISGDL